MRNWAKDELTRDQVEGYLRAGARWRITYCAGSDTPPVSGQGPELPPGVLEHVPTVAARRKIVRGQANRTYFHARLAGQEGDIVLELEVG